MAKITREDPRPVQLEMPFMADLRTEADGVLERMEQLIANRQQLLDHPELTTGRKPVYSMQQITVLDTYQLYLRNMVKQIPEACIVNGAKCTADIVRSVQNWRAGVAAKRSRR